jgi:hypothetical protein
MAQLKEFLYFLADEQGLCYYVSDNGGVMVKAFEPLEYTPDGWMNKSIQFSRNNVFKALFRQFTTPLKFVKDGAKILRHLFYNSGIEAAAYLIILKLDPVTFTHKLYYKGEVDFSTIKDQLNFVEVSLLEAGLVKLLKANENTLYEFDINGDETVQVNMDGLELSNKLNYIIPEVSFDNLFGGTDIFIPIGFINSEGDNYGITAQSQQVKNLDGWPADIDNYLFATSEKSIDVTIKGKIQFSADSISFSTINIVRWIWNGVAGATPSQANIFTITGAIANTVYEYNFNETYTVPKGGSIYFTIRGAGGGGAPTYSFLENRLDLTFIYKYQATYVPAITAFDLFRKIVQKIAGTSYSTVSSLLLSRPDIVVTSGDGIRNLPGAKIKTSLSQFFKSMDCLLHTGMEVNGLNAVLEERTFFYDKNTEILNLGAVASCTLLANTEDLFNTIKIGYVSKDSKFDSINGKYEFNTTHQYTTPITRVPKSLELVNPYRADMFGIEVVRINLDAKTTSDNSADNEVFLLNVDNDLAECDIDFSANKSFKAPASIPLQVGKRYTITGTNFNNGVYTILSSTPVVVLIGVPTNEYTVAEVTTLEPLGHGFISGNFKKLLRKTYDTITGLLYPTSAFNIEYSPKRCLFNHGSFVRSIMHKLEVKQIVFETTDKNPELLTIEAGVIRKEKGNVTIGDLPDPYFQPYVFSVQTSTPFNFAELIANTKGYISFEWNGNTYKGFLLSGEIQPATQENKEFRLLSHPDNDLTKMIHG